MDPQRQIIDWLQQDDARMAALRTVRRLGLNDWCLGAGFVRNLVWDRQPRLCGAHAAQRYRRDPLRCGACGRRARSQLEARLQQWLPQPWSVKNQARMHLRGGRAPYRNSEEAISFWTEVETAIGARLNADDSLTLVAPFGLAALFGDTITFNVKTAIALPCPAGARQRLVAALAAPAAGKDLAAAADTPEQRYTDSGEHPCRPASTMIGTDQNTVPGVSNVFSAPGHQGELLMAKPVNNQPEGKAKKSEGAQRQ